MRWALHQEMKRTCHVSNVVDAANLDGVFLMYQMPFHPYTNSASHLSVEMAGMKCHDVEDDSVDSRTVDPIFINDGKDCMALSPSTLVIWSCFATATTLPLK